MNKSGYIQPMFVDGITFLKRIKATIPRTVVFGIVAFICVVVKNFDFVVIDDHFSDQKIDQ